MCRNTSMLAEDQRLHTAGVGGSKPPAPTNPSNDLGGPRDRGHLVQTVQFRRLGPECGAGRSVIANGFGREPIDGDGLS